MSYSFCLTFNLTFLDVTGNILKRKFHVGRVMTQTPNDSRFGMIIYFAYDCWPVFCTVGTTWENQYLWFTPCSFKNTLDGSGKMFEKALLTWQSFLFRCHKVCKETHGKGPARRRGGAAASVRIEVQIRFHSYTRSSNGLEDISISSEEFVYL